jgi:hypothetical protein
MITVGRLRDILYECHDDTIVLLSSDAEGNNFRHFHEASKELVLEKDGGELYRKDFPEDIDDEDEVLVLWPV